MQVSPKMREEYLGERFGNLTIIEWDSVKNLWECLCDCGSLDFVRLIRLRSGKKTHCGCKRKAELEAKRMRRESHRAEYAIWLGMLGRCYGATKGNVKTYARYGARGITVCDRWRLGVDGLSAFQCFVADMGKRPSRGHSIDRIDNDAGYDPNNCRWATAKEQSRNTRRTVWVVLGGVKKSLPEWCEIFGVNPQRAYVQLKRKGKSPEEIFIKNRNA